MLNYENSLNTILKVFWIFLDIQKKNFRKIQSKQNKMQKKIARRNRRFTLASWRLLHPKRLAFLQENDQHPAHVQIDGTEFIE